MYKLQISMNQITNYNVQITNKYNIYFERSEYRLSPTKMTP